MARLKKRNFKQADKVPRTYDQRPFSLDGKMDLDITFCDTTPLKTPVYVKLDAPKQLLLSEGVCRQLGIISYHPEILVSQNDGSAPGERNSGQPKGTVAGRPVVDVASLDGEDQDSGCTSKRQNKPTPNVSKQETPRNQRTRQEV